MPRMEYMRDDFRIVLERTADGGATAQFSATTPKTQIPATVVREWIARGPMQPVAELGAALGVQEAVDIWQSSPPALMNAVGYTLRRIVLEIEDRELAAFPWEQAIAPLVAPYLRGIVRLSNVLPRQGTTPFTTPMRILQVGDTGDRPIARMMRYVFGSHTTVGIERIATVGTSMLDFITTWRNQSNWPTAEILHFDDYPLLEPELLSRAKPEMPGTLSWLFRLTSTWQTRLVVLPSRNAQEAMAARMLATALASVGGPAVLVADLGNLTPGWYYQEFYEQLIHDAPLDQCAFPSQLLYKGSERDPRLTLIAGGGREEALRFSALGEGLIALSQDAQAAAFGVPTPASAALEGLVRRTTAAQSGGPSPTGVGGRGTSNEADVVAPLNEVLLGVHHELDFLEKNWETMTFDFHESEGVVPLVERVEAARRAAHITGPAEAKHADPEPGAPRFVNASLGVSDEGGRVRRIPQDGDGLLLGYVYQLEIDIGPPDLTLRAVGAVPLLEEYFSWTNEMEGVWLDIGITGIDFTVLGDPVQELWLPREGATARATFAVVPQKPGVAQLRFCLYSRNNVIQSFRIAAATRSPESHPAPSAEAADSIARALDLPTEEQSASSWLTRIEYAIAADIRDSATAPERALSIVANALDGRMIVTVKGGAEFAVRDDIGDPEKLVARVRESLKALSEHSVTQVDGEKLLYLYGTPDGANAGDEARLKPALKTLAEVGWQLFDAVFPGREAERNTLLAKLAGDGDVIHIAHILLNKVIPWSTMYLRPYDAAKQEAEYEGTTYPVDHDACLAALPDEDGKFPSTSCGQLETCLLHEARMKARLAEDGKLLVPETVACPRAFLGFRHILELPPQQVEPPAATMPSDADASTKPDAANTTTGQRVSALRTEINVKKDARLAMGINAALRFFHDHETKLTSLCAGPPVRAVPTKTAYSRDAVLESLKEQDLDLIYFFCHARGVEGETLDPPVLEFQSVTGAPGAFDVSKVASVTWSHHPLIMVNACNTVGFSPTSLSPFIAKFVHDCEASGLIGTEVPVYEELSTEFAESFFTFFLDEKAFAGPALLRARRALLAQLNPLGLVYTLYAAANLHIVRVT